MPRGPVSEGLPGLVIATIKTHRVVDGEPRMSPAQEGLGKLLRDEAQLQEEADGALSQALGQAGGIVDGQSEDELTVGEGKEQLLIEVLGEQECPLLAA